LQLLFRVAPTRLRRRHASPGAGRALGWQPRRGRL